MPRNHRVRTRVLRMSQSGYVKRTAAGIPDAYEYSGPYQLGYEECDDWVGGAWTASPFSLKRGVFPRVSANGVHLKSGFTFTGVNVPLFGSLNDRCHRPWLYFNQTPLSDSALAVMAMANMNPNKPEVDLPVSLAELRELPSLIRDAGLVALNASRGGSAVKKVAKANLMAAFGIVPILADLKTLLNYVTEVDKREKYLRELATSKGKRLRRTLKKESWTASYQAIAFSSRMDIYVTPTQFKLDVTANRKYWFTARARLLNPPAERDIHALAFRAVTGTQVDPSTVIAAAWELLPWSWLIDWFSTTGNIVAALRNGITWQYEALCVMHETTYRSKGSFPVLSAHTTVSPQNPEGIASVLYRALPSVSFLPEFRTPYLTWKQWGILSSLLALRL